MPETLPSNLCVADVKTIIHGLKMAGFSFVDPQALTEINAMIKTLPSPEELDKMVENNMDTIKKIVSDVGKIMRIIEIYGQRDMEYKVRYKTRTGLPPRYKVMDWRNNMEQAAKELVRELVRISAVADDRGKFDVADKLVKCAKKVQDETLQEPDFIDVIDSMERSGFSDEAKIMRESVDWQKWIGRAKGVGRGIGGVYREMQVGGLGGKFKDFVRQLNAFKDKLTKTETALSKNPKYQQLQKLVRSLNDSIEIDAQGVEQMVAQIDGKLQQAGVNVDQIAPDADPAAANPAANPATPPVDGGTSPAATPEAATPEVAAKQVGNMLIQGQGNSPVMQDPATNELFVTVQGKGELAVVQDPKTAKYRLTGQPRKKAAPVAEPDIRDSVPAEPAPSTPAVPPVATPPAAAPSGEASARRFENAKNTGRMQK